MPDPTIVLAGATGHLGGKIAAALRTRGADVRALVRPGTASEKLDPLRQLGVSILTVDPTSLPAMTEACRGAACVVSALSGLRAAIVDAQTILLNAAVAAGVPRFIPSDFAADFTKVAPGANRNFDLRRDFMARLDAAPIAATSVFNGAFADILTGVAPIILFKVKRVVYWADADQLMDFTTMDNVATYTAAAALDPTTPRFLRIAGDQISARGLATVMSEVSGVPYRLLRPGGLGTLATIIKVTRTLVPASQDIYPPWQGMQYLHNMFSGDAKLKPLDNDRYPGMRWESARAVLAAHLKNL
ncbi:NmrA family NAD(P)-binding protein [Beijerinckia sp. L45]|uniref:NmrA family NAD(P)-binding protein n=1 Tax=Beijerinckia sp. L45 TaxID=1641855 RepID=UPI00131B8709|nr:NmrA family NAD(P)-binding protein [Beijerinckia sp. L45]